MIFIYKFNFEWCLQLCNTVPDIYKYGTQLYKINLYKYERGKE